MGCKRVTKASELLAEDRCRQAVQPVLELWEHRADQDPAQQAGPCADPDGGWIPSGAGFQLPEGALGECGGLWC